MVLSRDAINRLPLVVTVVVGTKEYLARLPNQRSSAAGNERLAHGDSVPSFQLRSLDPKRFPRAPAGKLVDATMESIENAVRYSLKAVTGRSGR